MTLLVRLELSADRTNESGFDAESHGRRAGAQAQPASRDDTADTDDVRYALDGTEGENKT